MTWTFTVDDRTITITDDQAVEVQSQLARIGRAGAHFEVTADDGTELTVDSDSSVTLTHDG